MARDDMIQVRAGTRAEWEAAETANGGEFVLAADEIAYIRDENAVVVGDGATTITALEPVGGGGGGGAEVASVQPFVNGRWQYPRHLGGGYPYTTQSAGTAQRLWLVPFYVGRAVTIDSLWTYTWTGESGALMRFGVYGADDDLVPTGLIADWGTASGAVSATVHTLTGLDTLLDPGWCFLAAASSNHSTVRWTRWDTFMVADRWSVIGSPAGTDPDVATGAITHRRATGDYSAALPSTPPASTWQDSATDVNLPCWLVREDAA